MPEYNWVDILCKVVIGTSLAYALFIVLFCPCSPVLDCHKTNFFVALGVAGVTAAACLWIPRRASST